VRRCPVFFPEVGLFACFGWNSGAGLDVPVETTLASKGEAEPESKRAKLNFKEQDDR
jgi:hypothetical protein